MKKVALYIRVSTEEQKQHGLSVDSQLTALQDFCKKNKYSIAGIYNDAGLSANKSYKKRPALIQMIEDCQAGLIDIVLFTRLDRFFRSVKDYYACIEQMNDVPWRAIWEDYETETSSGKFRVNIMLSIAQAESERTSEKIKSVNEYRRLQGKYVGGKAPTGYVKKDSGLIKDESNKEAVQAFFDTYAATYSMAKSREASKLLGFPIAKATAVRMLHNTAYYGNASGYECEPYITKEQFDLNNAEMKRFSRQPKHENCNYFFSGLIICNECGGHYTAKYGFDIMKDGTKKMRYGYQCSRHRNNPDVCSGGYLGQYTMEQFLLNNIEDIIEKSKVSASSNSKDTNKNQKKIKELNAKLERISVLFEEGDLSIDKYREKKADIKKQIMSFDATKKIDHQLPKNWKDTYKSLDGEHKRAFWHKIIDKILVDKKHKYNPTVFLK